MFWRRMCGTEHLHRYTAALQAMLQYSDELVCLAMDANSLAVGSQSHVTLLDARQRGAVQHIDSTKPNSVRRPASPYERSRSF